MPLASLFLSPCLARLGEESKRYRQTGVLEECLLRPIRASTFERQRKNFSMAYHPGHAAGAPVDFRKGVGYV
jgi:hypothetical protein